MTTDPVDMAVNAFKEPRPRQVSNEQIVQSIIERGIE